MSKLYRTIVLFVITAFIASCGGLGAMPEVSITRHPKPADFSGFHIYTEPPAFDPNSNEPFQVDLRSTDLTEVDLSRSTDALMYADFDSKTQWPASNRMPVDFNWRKIMENGKDPGLGMRTLHDQGITGNGVGIAIIDQPLLVDHQEYKDHLQLYEEINIQPDTGATMHGAAVASIAVGKTLGVAPEADLYYIGAWTGDWEAGTNNFTWNFTYYAQAVRRILEINRGLPAESKIRVIAMQIGFKSERADISEIMSAINEAKADGVFVICSTVGDIYEVYFHGLGRDPLEDPNQFEAYGPGMWWEKDFYAWMTLTSYPPGKLPKQTPLLLVPMDSRTTASPTGTEDYAFYRQGGWSWSIPYLAGMYALAVQVKPDIAPQEFWAITLETGRTIQIPHDGKDYELGVILDPRALIEEIKSK